MDSLQVQENEIMNLRESVEDVLNVQLGRQSVDEVKKFLKEKCQFYKEENAKMEAAIKKLGLLKQDLCPEAQKAIETLANLQSSYESKDLRSESLSLSHTERLRKHSNYITKIKMCIKMYANLNEKLTNNIKVAKSELSKSKCKLNTICTISKDELKSLEAKVRRYENELLKFEKKYPWLSDPQFNLPNISKEMETLAHLRQIRAKLLEELDAYQGLEPNVEEANQQLRDIIQEHEQVSKNITKML